MGELEAKVYILSGFTDRSVDWCERPRYSPMGHIAGGRDLDGMGVGVGAEYVDAFESASVRIQISCFCDLSTLASVPASDVHS